MSHFHVLKVTRIDEKKSLKLKFVGILPIFSGLRDAPVTQQIFLDTRRAVTLFLFVLNTVNIEHTHYLVCHQLEALSVECL